MMWNPDQVSSNGLSPCVSSSELEALTKVPNKVQSHVIWVLNNNIFLHFTFFVNHRNFPPLSGIYANFGLIKQWLFTDHYN